MIVWCETVDKVWFWNGSNDTEQVSVMMTEVADTNSDNFHMHNI